MAQVVTQISPCSWWLGTVGSWVDCMSICAFAKISSFQEKLVLPFYWSVVPLLQCCKSCQYECNSTHLAIWHHETISCTGLFTLSLLSANLAFSKILITSLLLLYTSRAVFPHTTTSSMYCKCSGALTFSKTFCTSPWQMGYASILVAEGSRHTVLLSR